MNSVETILTKILRESTSLPLYLNSEKNEINDILILELKDNFPSLLSKDGEHYNEEVRRTLNKFYKEKKVFENGKKKFVLEQTCGIFDAYYFAKLI